MSPDVLGELRILSSADFDATSLLTVVLSGDGRLLELLRQEDLVPLGTRIRTRLVTEAASREELLELLRHALAKAGNATLMTAELMDTLVDHSAGNYRLLMIMGARAAGLRHGARRGAARREVLPGGLSAEELTPRAQEESEGVKMPADCSSEVLPVVRVGEIAQRGERPSAGWWKGSGATSSVGVIGGAPKCAKTWLGLDLALSVATGTACLGKYAVPEPGPVLVYLAEDALPVVRERIEGMARHRGLDLGRSRGPRDHRAGAPARSRSGPHAAAGRRPGGSGPGCCCSIPWCDCTASTRTTPAKWPSCWRTFASCSGSSTSRSCWCVAGVRKIRAPYSADCVEDQQPRPQPPGRLPQPRAVRIAIEPEHRRGHHVDLDAGEIEATMPGHPLDPLPHYRQRILRQIDQDRTRLGHGVLAQACRAGGHREGQVQPQPGLGAFGGTADHTHRRIAREPFHKPAWGPLGMGNSPTRTTGSVASALTGLVRRSGGGSTLGRSKTGKRWFARASSDPHFLLQHGRGFLGSKTPGKPSRRAAPRRGPCRGRRPPQLRHCRRGQGLPRRQPRQPRRLEGARRRRRPPRPRPGPVLDAMHALKGALRRRFAAAPADAATIDTIAAAIRTAAAAGSHDDRHDRRAARPSARSPRSRPPTPAATSASSASTSPISCRSSSTNSRRSSAFRSHL